MIGRRKTAAVCLLVLCFALTACGRAEPPEPRLVEYYGGVLNTAGQVIIPPPPKKSKSVSSISRAMSYMLLRDFWWA